MLSPRCLGLITLPSLMELNISGNHLTVLGDIAHTATVKALKLSTNCLQVCCCHRARRLGSGGRGLSSEGALCGVWGGRAGAVPGAPGGGGFPSAALPSRSHAHTAAYCHCSATWGSAWGRRRQDRPRAFDLVIALVLRGAACSCHESSFRTRAAVCPFSIPRNCRSRLAIALMSTV